MTDEKGQEPQAGVERPRIPPLDSVDWAFLRVHPWSNSAMFARQPIGVIRWADRELSVYAATPLQLEELKTKLGCADEAKLRQRAVYGSPQDVAEATWLAFGGDKSPMSKDELVNMPRAFMLAAKEAANAFLWEGPGSAMTRPMPKQKEPAS